MTFGDFPILVCAAVLVQDRKVLLTRRRAVDHLGGLWEFPGGKMHPGETPPEALRRELLEELTIDAAVGRPLGFSFWEYPEKRVLILFYECTMIGGHLTSQGNDGWQWVEIDKLREIAMPPADVLFVEELGRLTLGLTTDEANRTVS